MQQITIETAAKAYPVYIGHGAIKMLGDFLEKSNFTSVMVITDENVAEHHLAFFREQSGLEQFVEKIVPGGEKAKTFDVYYDCLTTALESRLDRKSLIISFGGGAVGDLAGFVAATYMRGISFIQLPTTILAHDSAVGGKVAINHPLGKNMIGAFHQPEAVIYDLDFIKTLSEREVRSGFAEVIKHSLISDSAFYEWLKRDINSLRNIDGKTLMEFLSKGVKIKGAVVAQDERETGIRAYLNFGHTLGHAIEAEMGYGRMTHGEAVAIGMLFSLELSQDILRLDFDLASFRQWLNTLGYQSYLPEGLSIEKLISRMQQDKKAVNGKVRFVLLEKAGKPVLSEIDEGKLAERLKKFAEEGKA
jgi:3-dehydroquinate synthase